jgi:hypothetical protein
MKLDPTLAALKLRNDQLRAENERLQKALDQDDQDYVVTSRQLRAENERLHADRTLMYHEIERLRARLEVSPDHDYDGIDCRDETIKMLEGSVERLREALRLRLIDQEEREKAQREREERLRSLLRQCIPSLQRDGRPHVVGMVQAALGDIVTVAADQQQAATSPAPIPGSDSKSPPPRST